MWFISPAHSLKYLLEWKEEFVSLLSWTTKHFLFFLALIFSVCHGWTCGNQACTCHAYLLPAFTFRIVLLLNYRSQNIWREDLKTSLTVNSNITFLDSLTVTLSTHVRDCITKMETYKYRLYGFHFCCLQEKKKNSINFSMFTKLRNTKYRSHTVQKMCSPPL